MRNMVPDKVANLATVRLFEWTKDADCKNDGLQFHMSALRPSELGGPSGRMGSTYDSKLHNAYRLSNEQEDIRQFHVNLTITGTAKDQVVAEVSHQRNGDMLRLAKQTQQMDPGDSLILKGGLPKQLNITRMSNGCEYEFTFSKNTDAAYFHFSTHHWIRGGKTKDAQAEVPGAIL